MPEKIWTEQEAADLLKKYPLPWTLEKLGEEKYTALAVEGGFFNSPPSPKHFAPDLAPPEPVLALHQKKEAEKKAAEEKLAEKKQ